MSDRHHAPLIRPYLPHTTTEKWLGRIVVLGSANLDLVFHQERLPAPGETIFGQSLDRVPGGKGLNQAIAMTRAGGEVAFIGCVGDDDEGAQLSRLMADEGVDVHRLTQHPQLGTGIAQVAVLDDGDNAIVVIAGANGSDEWDGADEALVASAAALVTQLERPPQLVRIALEAAREHGVVTVLTPAPVSEDAKSLLPLVDILLLNEHEAKQLAGLAEAAAAARTLSDICPLVIMTRGQRSTLVAREGSLVHEQATRVSRVVDTTGAGDCFAGTVIARLAAGDGLEEALRIATVAASLSVGRPGASRSMPTWAEVLTADGQDRAARHQS